MGDRSPIEQAIDSATRKRAVAAQPKVVTLPILPTLRIDPGDSLTLPIQPKGATVVMVVDPTGGGWRPVLFAPGSRWELREVVAEPLLWQPDKAR